MPDRHLKRIREPFLQHALKEPGRNHKPFPVQIRPVYAIIRSINSTILYDNDTKNSPHPKLSANCIQRTFPIY